MRRALFALPLLFAAVAFASPASAQRTVQPTVPHAPLTPCVDPCSNPDIEVHYLSPLSYFTSGTQTIDFGTTTVGTAVSLEKIAIGATQGFDDLTIFSIAMPAGFTLVYGPNISPTLEQAGASHGTKIKCDATSPGIFSGNLTINSDDPDEGTFTIGLTCTVNQPTTEVPPAPSTEAPATTESPSTTDNGSETNNSTGTTDLGSGGSLPVNGTDSGDSLRFAALFVAIGVVVGLVARRRPNAA